MYSLKKEDQDILLPKQELLNDHFIDVTQKLICREIGTESIFQSALNSEYKVTVPFKAVTQE